MFNHYAIFKASTNSVTLTPVLTIVGTIIKILKESTALTFCLGPKLNNKLILVIQASVF